jgi:hypothetical protein
MAGAVMVAGVGTTTTHTRRGRGSLLCPNECVAQDPVEILIDRLLESHDPQLGDGYYTPT